MSVYCVPDSDSGLGDIVKKKAFSEYFICADYQTMLFSFVEPPLSKSIFIPSALMTLPRIYS